MHARTLAVIVVALSVGSACSESTTPRCTLPYASQATDVERSKVMDYASSQVGKRYCWGGTGPACFDCSGLVQRAWYSVGVRLPRTADAIASELEEVPLDEVRAGDILWWPGHVGLYAGNGWEVEALDKRHGVVRRPLAHPRRAFRPPG